MTLERWVGLTKTKQKDHYKTVRLPRDFAVEIDKLIGTHGFTSRAEIVKMALREFLKEYEYTPAE